MRRALICVPVMPEFDRDSGGRRFFDLVEILVEDGWSVTLFAQSAQPEHERYARALRQRGVRLYVGNHSLWAGDEYTPDLRSLIREGAFDVALVAFWNFAEILLPLLRHFSPRTQVLIDTIDLHFVRNARKVFRAALSEAQGQLNSDYARDLVRELNVYAAADGLMMVSREEAAFVTDLLSESTYAPVVPLLDETPESPISCADRKGILFVGSFRHPPNEEGIAWFCREVLPNVPAQVLEHHPVYVVGYGFDQRIAEMIGHNPYVRKVGWVPSVVPYLYQARMTVLPLLHGAGTKGKLIQALLAATPSVSTSVGIEGLALENGRHVVVADSAERFANEVQRLATDDDLWSRVSLEGRLHAFSRHSRTAVRAALRDALDGVLSRQAGGLSAPLPSA